MLSAAECTDVLTLRRQKRDQRRSNMFAQASIIALSCTALQFRHQTQPEIGSGLALEYRMNTCI